MTAINNSNTRTVQRVNIDGFRISIPKEIANKVGIGYGDILHFEIEDKKLILKKVEEV